MIRSTLILGGAKSGKSTLAQAMAESHDGPLVYLATAQALDGEMEERIAAHQSRRGPSWTTLEEPIQVARALAQADRPGGTILLDCVTLWLNNLMGQGLDDPAIQGRGRELSDTITGLQGRVIIVSNEVGQGIVPVDAMARRFRDLAGWLNQRLAETCNQVLFVAAGLPLALKGPSPRPE